MVARQTAQCADDSWRAPLARRAVRNVICGSCQARGASRSKPRRAAGGRARARRPAGRRGGRKLHRSAGLSKGPSGPFDASGSDAAQKCAMRYGASARRPSCQYQAGSFCGAACGRGPPECCGVKSAHAQRGRRAADPSGRFAGTTTTARDGLPKIPDAVDGAHAVDGRRASDGTTARSTRALLGRQRRDGRAVEQHLIRGDVAAVVGRGLPARARARP